MPFSYSFGKEHIHDAEEEFPVPDKKKRKRSLEVTSGEPVTKKTKKTEEMNHIAVKTSKVGVLLQGMTL